MVEQVPSKNKVAGSIPACRSNNFMIKRSGLMGPTDEVTLEKRYGLFDSRYLKRKSGGTKEGFISKSSFITSVSATDEHEIIQRFLPSRRVFLTIKKPLY